MSDTDIDNELKAEQAVVISEVADKIAESARTRALNWGSQRIRKAIEVSGIVEWQGGLGMYIKVNKSVAPQAEAFEHGAAPHSIDAKNSDYLIFEGTNEFDGQTIRTEHVNHPGIQPRPFMKPAFDEYREYANQQFRAAGLRSISRVIRDSWNKGGGK